MILAESVNTTSPRILTTNAGSSSIKFAVYQAAEPLVLALPLIQVLHQRYPELPQLACYDTSFHCTMPRVAKLPPIPRGYAAQGVQGYGFHGMSST